MRAKHILSKVLSTPRGINIMPNRVHSQPTHNSISNLQCLTPQQHADRHPWSTERIAKQAEHLESIRPLTKAWHASAEGRAVHRRIGSLAYANFKPEPKPCEQCGCVFEPGAVGNRDRFCSNNCKSAHRRASGVDDVDKQCDICGCTFRSNRYRKSKTCSRSCGARARGRTMRAGV